MKNKFEINLQGYLASCSATFLIASLILKPNQFGAAYLYRDLSTEHLNPKLPPIFTVIPLTEAAIRNHKILDIYWRGFSPQ